MHGLRRLQRSFLLEAAMLEPIIVNVMLAGTERLKSFGLRRSLLALVGWWGATRRIGLRDWSNDNVIGIHSDPRSPRSYQAKRSSCFPLAALLVQGSRNPSG